VKLAVWTGRDRASGEELLKFHVMTDLFATIVYGDDLATHKPEPEGMGTILTRLDVSPGEALFVGDADVDVLGGFAGGVDTVLIRHGRTIAADVEQKAWRAVESPTNAFELLLACTS
jgi:phosphoglycolate phosphatase-like HAD superfamily hydrolase